MLYVLRLLIVVACAIIGLSGGENVLIAGGRDDLNGFLRTAAIFGPDGTWEDLPEMTSPRNAVGVASLDYYVYALGGQQFTQKGYTATKSAERYNLRTHKWEKIHWMTTKRRFLAAVALNGLVYAVGGSDANDKSLASAERYDPQTNTWEAIASLPGPRFAPAAAAIGECIYVVGGSYESSNFEFCHTNGVWKEMAPMSTGRRWHAATAYAGLMYVCGGLQDEFFLPSCEVYNPSHNTWSLITDLPSGRIKLAMSAVDGRILALGGRVKGYSLSEVLSYNIEDNRWTHLSNGMHAPRNSFGVAVVPSQLSTSMPRASITTSPISGVEDVSLNVTV